MLRKLTLIAAVLVAGPAFAQDAVELTSTGDAAEGEKAFRQCQSCHVVQNAEGEVLAGRAAKTGPNLYGVAGAPYGSIADFSYSDVMMAAAAAGAVHDTEEDFVAYVMDPTEHLRELSGEDGRGKMTYKVRKEEDAINLWAFLIQYPATPES
ncbi:MAG: cytochrome C [Jannaschia sp.]